MSVKVLGGQFINVKDIQAAEPALYTAVQNRTKLFDNVAVVDAIALKSTTLAVGSSAAKYAEYLLAVLSVAACDSQTGVQSGSGAQATPATASKQGTRRLFANQVNVVER